MVANAFGMITFQQGFKASGVRAGLKESGPDLALIVSDVPAVAAGVFTTNVFKAAPVVLCQSRLPSASIRAIVVNSGNANACTGEQGTRDAEAMAAQTAKLLGMKETEVLVASTGIIGKPMPMDKIRSGITEAVGALSIRGGEDAALAILTTDSRAKEVSNFVKIGGSTVHIGGMAKGSGMICPNVATMLAFFTTDLAITPEMLQLALARSAEVTFNCLTVDGDTSTNDSVIILANGMACNPIIDREGPELDAFCAGLTELSSNLAYQIASDGEGATKSITVKVSGAGSFKECRQIAMTIANSPLVKTAMFGCDPNWGRIVAAAGRAGVDFQIKDVDLFIGDFQIINWGDPVPFSEKDASEYLKQDRVLIDLRVGTTEWNATVFTCDFSYEYVKINAEYHT
jgi:glutamate N-acetyltransferase/amino-acid N-acetyltransferase